jgi:hypothetical protein
MFVKAIDEQCRLTSVGAFINAVNLSLFLSTLVVLAHHHGSADTKKLAIDFASLREEVEKLFSFGSFTIEQTLVPCIQDGMRDHEILGCIMVELLQCPKDRKSERTRSVAAAV